jgi:VWFA-related protein
VVAQDKNGQPVADLSKDDFELFVNHKPQQIATFTVTSVTPASPVALPPGTFSNRQTASEVSQGRYTVFLLDWHNTNWQLQSWSHQELAQMLTDLPAGSKAALYVIDNGLQIIQEFTSDHELLKARAESLWGQIQAPITGVDQAELAAHQTVAAFQAIAKHLAGISGQKVLVWVSTGFPLANPRAVPPGAPPVRPMAGNFSPVPAFLEDIDKAVHLLGSSNIVVESTEARYLNASLSPATGPTKTFVESLEMIAERTGGRFFPGDTNDFASTLRDAANDRSTSYELGYYAGDNLQPGLQPFEIVCRRPGVTLRYREGFYVDKRPTVVKADSHTEAQDVLERAVDAVQIPLTATATRTMGNVPSIVLRLNVDPGALTLRHDGVLWRAKVSVLARFADEEDFQIGDVPLDSPALNLTEAQHDKALRDGLTLRFPMKMPAGAATLRVLVRDEASGNMGSVTIPVADLPEF